MVPLAFQGYLQSLLELQNGITLVGLYQRGESKERFSAFTSPFLMFHLGLTQGIAAFPEEPALTLRVGAPELAIAPAQHQQPG